MSPNSEDNHIINWITHVAPATRLKKIIGYLRKIRIKKEIKKYLKIMAKYLDNERYKGDIFYFWRTNDKQTPLHPYQI